MVSSRWRNPLSGSEKRWRERFARRVDALEPGQACDTPFLDPFQLDLARGVLRERPHFAYAFYGGYPGAERVRLRVFPREQHGGPPPVQALQMTGSFSMSELSPRDVLGALLGLGLKRDQVGDVFFLPAPAVGEAVAMVHPDLAGYVCAQLETIGNYAVCSTTVDSDALPLPEPRGREVCGTVASMRLDAVLALGFGLSRSRAAGLVKGGLVRVDWRAVESPARPVRPGEIISLSGRGRLEVVSLGGETRKGRLRLTLKKFS